MACATGPATPTGSPRWFATFRFVDGKIAEHWANRDDLGFLRQVREGQVPPPDRDGGSLPPAAPRS